MKRKTLFESRDVVLGTKGKEKLVGNIKVEEVTASADEGDGDDCVGCSCGWTPQYAANYDATFGRKGLN